MPVNFVVGAFKFVEQGNRAHGNWEEQQLMRAFALSHFSYCPLFWMFYDRTLNHRINHIHERALRIAYKDYGNDFGFLLEQINSVPIHVRNRQLLMTEIYKKNNAI